MYQSNAATTTSPVARLRVFASVGAASVGAVPVGAAPAPFAVDALALVDLARPFTPPQVQLLLDDALIAAQRDLAEVRRRVDAAAASIAAEIAHRSRQELGHSGLAQRLGNRTPEKLVQHLTGSTARDAAAMVRVGFLLPGSALATTDAPLDSDPTADTRGDAAGTPLLVPSALERPWLSSVGAAAAAALLSVGAADAIRAGLGDPDCGCGVGGSADHEDSHGVHGVSVGQLAAAAAQLVDEAPRCTVDQLAVRARAMRALLDADADADADAESSRINDAEQALRDRRYLWLSRQSDGMTRLSGLLDPESAALVASAIDGATSPRRGGPRFVEAGAAQRAEAILRDARTTEQLAVDALVELVRLGGAVAPTEVIGARPPAVQVIVTARDLAARRGLARIEGQTEAVSTATAERHVCEAGTVPIVIDEGGDVIELGRETRLYTRRQRIALAARDGGCRFPDCERPPSWTEAHHIVPWSHGGRTDVRDGVLLCRHHHLLLHNNGWRFERHPAERNSAGLVLIPPRTIDPEQVPIPAPSKSATLARALA